jgi:hypothetical protein
MSQRSRNFKKRINPKPWESYVVHAAKEKIRKK